MKQLYAKDYRKKAEEICKPYSDRLAVIYLIYAIVISAASGMTYGIAGLLITGPLLFGIIHVMKEAYSKKQPQYETLFSGFKRFGEAFLIALLKGVFIFLWSLLLWIPGIIKTYSYAMAEYIMDDDSSLNANDAITKSREIMNGHKWELFCMEFSYIGWYILCALTFGILSLWVMPKVFTARYAFYLHITGKDEEASGTVEGEVI